MNNKPLTAEDLVVGGKYVPHSKSVGDPITKSNCVRWARERNQPYLFYNGCFDGNHLFNESYDIGNITGDFFLPSDVTPYHEPNECCGGYCPTFGTTCILDEPNQTTMNTDYTEQPFNLETALKHPEWVRTRDGREIDFIKEYDSFIVAVMKNGSHNEYPLNGIFRHRNSSNNDLFIIAPLKKIWVNIYPCGKSEWYSTENFANERVLSSRIACVPVKIPAV